MPSYQVYVIELDKKVFSQNRKFREANPQFNGVLECLYVGMSSKTPQARFKQHKTGARSKKGIKISANIVEKYGLYLRSSLFAHIAPVKSRTKAIELEEALGIELRRKNYAVWWN